MANQELIEVSQESYMSTQFKFKFPSIDVARIVKLQGIVCSITFTYERAFHHYKLVPMDINKTGLQFGKQHYIDTTVHSDITMGRSVIW